MQCVYRVQTEGKSCRLVNSSGIWINNLHLSPQLKIEICFIYIDLYHGYVHVCEERTRATKSSVQAMSLIDCKFLFQ